MASKKKQQAMVFERIGSNSPSVASEAWSSLTPTALKPRNTSKGSDGTGCRRSDVFGRSNMHPTKEMPEKSGRQLSTKHDVHPKNQSDNLSPDCCRRGIKVTLDNNNMWNQFFRCKTEMIVTKEGSRMFPSCRFRVSGLQPSKNYVFVMDIRPADDHRYKWDGTSWIADGKAERHVKSRPFFHHESPAVGQHWMQNPVSFYQMKLTSNILDRDEKTVLHPAQRYLPRLHVIQTDKATKDLDLKGPNVVTFAFPQMEFMAVTAYQNKQFVKLKVDYNPFAKGLKDDGGNLLGHRQKVNAGTDLSKDGGHSTKEQYPMKKSLKSLLANHKPRSSKPADPSLTPEVLEKSVNRPGVESSPRSSSGGTPPAQKLFSDLIREAHVALKRCDVDQLCVSEKARAPSVQISCDQAKQRNIKESARQSSRERSTMEAVETSTAKKKVKEIRRASNLHKHEDRLQVSEAPVQNSSKLQEQSEASAKPLKRPAPLPLPALARFLKQHSLQSKKAKNQAEPPPTNAAPKSAFQLSCPQARTIPHKDSHTDTTKVQFGESARTDPDQNSIGGGQARTSNYQCSSMEKDMSSSDRSTSALQRSSRHGSPVLAQSDRLCGNFESTLCPTPSGSGTLSGPGESLLPSVCLPHLPPEAVSTTLPSKPYMPLPDPNCSFMFEPLSPASSPEPLPALPVSLALALDPNSPEQVAKRPHSGEMLAREDSVFKWHTLLPPSETPFIDVSYPTFQPSLQQLPLPMTLHNTPPASQPIYPPHSSIPSFQDNEQSLPFPAELSPLALPLALSPTFSSLDGEGLSPTPSIADLVQFFSNTDELGMGVEFPPTEEAPPSCLPPISVESTATEVQQQVKVAAKTCKTKKKSRSRKLDKPSVDDELHESDTTMRPNMEEVEEQLFISFTSKEALKLHIPGSPEDPEPVAEDDIRTDNLPQVEVQPPLWAEVQSQPVSPKPEAHSQLQALTNDSPQPQKTELESEIQPGPTNEAQLPLQTEGSPQPPSQTEALLSTEAGQPLQNEALPEPLIERPTERRPPKGPRRSKFKQVPVERETVAEVEGHQEDDQTIIAAEKILLRDVKLMRHRQIIHPVLQEVGLKMNLLDPTLTIDLQYLGVRLPIPPPGVPLQPPTQEEPLKQSVSPVFVSRTGKASDVTQIKGWREKFTPSEPSAFPEADKPEAPPVTPETTKKNLSAFCSDMLDEYLENEGKLIDQRAASFSDNLVEAPPFQLPLNNSLSRPLNTPLSSSSSLISGFVPPSKRPKLPTREPKISRKGERKQKILKKKSNPNPPDVGPTETSPSVRTNSPSPEVPLPFTEPVKEKTTTTPELLRRKKRFKPKSSTQSLDLPRPSADMAPLESDTELDPPDQSSESPVMTRALLKQRDLEDGVMWEGRQRTCVTLERAGIALTSLFTLSGFVSENPTAPILLPRRQTPSCLNDFCRLGCICSSLARNPRSSHCGRPECMFGCSCLKQKVVLLKHLDSSDSGSSHHSRGHRRRRHKKRMKMAYVLKDADSAAHPAERIRTLWKRHNPDSDPDPIFIPKSPLRHKVPQTLCHSKGPKMCDNQKTQVQALNGSCARVRVFRGKKMLVRTKGGSSSSDRPTKPMMKKPTKKKKGKRMGMKVSAAAIQAAGSEDASSSRAGPTQSPGAKPKFTKLSELLKNLTIMAECTWDNMAERNTVIMTLCKLLAQGRLDKPMWIHNYMIRPFTYTVKEDGEEPQVQYRVYISKPPAGRKTKSESTVNEEPLVQDKSASPVEEEIPEVKTDPVEDWQRALDSEIDENEAESVEDWQREVESDEADNVDKDEPVQQIMTKDLALPFLSRVSPAGFLSASLKQPNNSDVVQVNGKFYPLAKIQLGMMGALHPANRLAAYLTGRVGVAKRPPSSSSSVESAQATSTPPVESAPTTSTPPVESASATATPPVESAPVTSTPPVESAPATSTPPVNFASTTNSSEPPQTSSSVLKIQVQHPAAPAVSPSLLSSMVVQSSAQLIPLPLVPAPPSQKIMLKMVMTKTGEKLFRRPDGKLVRLVPVSQLKKTDVEAQKGVSAASALPCTVPAPSAPQQPSSAPVLPVNCGLSGLKNFIASQNLVMLHSTSNQVNQNGACATIKVLPQPSKQSHLFLRLNPIPSAKTASTPPIQPAGPAVVPLTASKVKEVEVTPASVSEPPPAAVVTLTPPAVQTPAAAQNPAPTSSPTGSHRVCTQNEQEVKKVEVNTEEHSSDGEMEDSSASDEGNSDEEKVLKDEHRRDHNQKERWRRGELVKLFKDLRKVMGLKTPLSQLSILDKATTEIQNLAATELDLLIKKRSLSKRRDSLLSTIAPSSGGSSPSQQLVNSNDEADTKSPEETWDEDECAALEILRSLLRQTHTSDLQLLDLVRQEISDQQDLMRRLRGVKKRLKQQRESLVRQISEHTGQSPEMIQSKPLSSKPSEVEMIERSSPSTSAPPLPAALCNNPLPDIQVAPRITSPAPAPQQVTSLACQDAAEQKRRTHPIILRRSRQKATVLKQKRAEAPMMPGATLVPLPVVEAPDRPAESYPADVTTLLHELSFLNQTSARLLPQKPSTPDKATSLPQDPANNQTTPPEDTQGDLNGHLETQQRVESVTENLKGSVLAPPPLLQMRVDAPKKTEPAVASSQHSEEGVAWRPMPRLVPLGLKGAPPT
ncbi:uncharacterized protein LOC128747175 isoform X2 [Synchiropus splendidus]|uniref:uncharacterized protein LOC128747175 isoform X2 n=1 Tax=Synchiropus splendidus TaxID=270530 RepID=UPI00237ED058|nr:uncharacterized protein LOC128747175 isoform X2 [Synchiropus splendidus]